MPQQRFSQSLFFVSTCLLVARGLGGASLAAQEGSMVGKWESVARSRGGIGSTLEFHSDGTISLTPGAMVDFAYRFDGTRLVMSFTDPDTGGVSEDTLDVHMSGDSMILSALESGQETQLVRAQPAEADTPPMVGTWSFTHSTGGTAFQIFTADGNMHLRVPFRTDRGTYMLSGDTLTTVIDGQDARQVRYTIDGARLTLSSLDGSPHQDNYYRVPW